MTLCLPLPHFASAFAFIFLLPPTTSPAEPPAQPFDRRVGAALFTLNEAKGPGGKRVKEWDPEKITQAQFETLNVRQFDTDARKYVAYAVHFGAAAPVDTRGAYRITVGGGEAADIPKPKAGPGWTPHPANDAKDPKKIAFFYKDVPAGNYREVVARQKAGGLMLSVFQRRPPRESIDDAFKAVNERHADLMAMAKQYKLFRTGQIKQVLLSEDGRSEVAELARAPRPFELGDQPKLVRVRVKVVDEDGTPLDNVKRLTVELTGWLATSKTAQAKLNDILGGKREGSRIVLDEPKPGFVDVIITLPPRSAELEREIFNQLKSGGGAGLRVGAAFK